MSGSSQVAHDRDPWLLVRRGLVRYYYRGQHVTWASGLVGVLPARIIQPTVDHHDRYRWAWVTSLGLPKPPSYCLIEVEGQKSTTIFVDVGELRVYGQND